MKYFLLFITNIVIFCALSWFIFIGVGTATACVGALLSSNMDADSMVSLWLYSLLASMTIAGLLMSWGWYNLYRQTHPNAIPPYLTFQ